MACLLTVVRWRRVALAGTWIHMRNLQQSGSFCSRNACLRVAGPPYQYWKTAVRYSVNPRVGMLPSDVMTAFSGEATRGLESPKGAPEPPPTKDRAHSRASCIVPRIRH
jgi:hypothetical protein